MSRVDVAVPCYNYGQYVGQCLESVLEQDVEGLRVLVIDNASNDNSVEVVTQFMNKDSRVSLVTREQNLGANASYNEAVDWATSDYFLLLDADDLLATGSLKRAVTLLDHRPDVAFTCGIEATLNAVGEVEIPHRQRQKVQSEWSIMSGDTFIAGFCADPVNWVGAPTVIRRTSVQKKVGYYRETLPYTDDMEMWLRLAVHGSVAVTPEVQAIRRHHAKSHGATYEKSYVLDVIEREAAISSFFANEGGSDPRARGRLLLAKKRLGEQAYWVGASRFARGRFNEGARLLAYSFRKRPTWAFLPPINWLLRRVVSHGIFL